MNYEWRPPRQQLWVHVAPKQTQPWSHLLSSAAAGVQHIWAAAQRRLLGGQRVTDVLDGFLPGRGQRSGGASTHRADRLWSRRCFYFTAARTETANICQLTATAQMRNYTCQLTLNGDVHFRKNIATFQIKSSRFFCLKVTEWSNTHPWYLIYRIVFKVLFSCCVRNSQKWRENLFWINWTIHDLVLGWAGGTCCSKRCNCNNNSA